MHSKGDSIFPIRVVNTVAADIIGPNTWTDMVLTYTFGNMIMRGHVMILANTMLSQLVDPNIYRNQIRFPLESKIVL